MAPNNENNPQAGLGRPLPKKESDLFKNVVKHYELKQYKKSVKQAETILKKFPNHGETLVMKGLVLNCLGKREEAHSLVKQGLMNDMRSHVCWHVYGLLHRSDRNYNEAIKAYKQALRIDSDNLQILRDLSMLQVQMRDLEGFAVTRHTILTLKPNGKINWLAFALAKHLTGDLRGAVSVIDIYLGTLTEGAPELARGFEASELALYRNRILAEIPGNTREAINHLETCSNVVVDRTSWLIAKAKYHLSLKEFDDCRATVLQTFERGMTENFKLHSLYMCAVLGLDQDVCEEAWRLSGTRTLASMMPLSRENKDTLLRAYELHLFPKYGSSAAMQRVPMHLVEEKRMRAVMDVFLRKGLVKGVPSLYLELSTFFLAERDGRFHIISDPFEVKLHPVFKLVVDLVDGYISSLASSKRLLMDDQVEESPSTELWTWFLRAGLHELAGEYMDGITLLDRCLEHTPTAVDAYEMKARLLKSTGDIKAAVTCLDEGRDLDRQDRYINNQTTKYMLEAGMQQEALKRISLFTKHEGNPEANLYDMQCSWYELSLASCYEKQGLWGKSLKKYFAVVKHFDDFQEDQFDFHGYCVRKVTLRAYTEVLRFEDSLWAEDYYFKAATGIINIYLHLHDNPSILSLQEEPDYSKMTAAERKKAKAIARKKRLQAEKAAERTKNTSSDNGSSSKTKGKPSPIEEDPDGKELLKQDPLETANRYSMILSRHSPTRFATWVAQYKIAVRRKKWLLGLQALFKMRELDPRHPEYFSHLIDFCLLFPKAAGLEHAVQSVLQEELSTLLSGDSVSAFARKKLQHVKDDPLTSIPCRVAVAQGLVKLGELGVADAADLIVASKTKCRGITVESCRAALAALKALGPEAEGSRQEWIQAVKGHFPLIIDFS